MNLNSLIREKEKEKEIEEIEETEIEIERETEGIVSDKESAQEKENKTDLMKGIEPDNNNLEVKIEVIVRSNIQEID